MSSLISASHRVLCERVAVLLGKLDAAERRRLLEVLNDPSTAADSDHLLLGALERCGGAEMLRIALVMLNDGRDPVNAILDRIGA